MQKDHFVSIIIPTLNEESVIRECLSSIRNLKTPPNTYEIIVVDSNSTDRTREIASEFGATIITNDSPRLTISASRNMGARQAKGDILAFLDADCLVSKNWLNSALLNYERPNVSLVGHMYQIPENSSLTAKAWDVTFADKKVKGVVDWLPAGNMFISKECFEYVRGFDESLTTNEDVDFCHRLRQEGYQIFSDPAIRVIHLGTPQTCYELYIKELWHGIGAFQVFLNDLHKIRNVRPVTYALFYILCLGGIVLSLVITVLTQSMISLIILVSFVIIAILVPFVLSIAVAPRKGSYNLLIPLTMVYITYGFARAACLIQLLNLRYKKKWPAKEYR